MMRNWYEACCPAYVGIYTLRPLLRQPDISHLPTSDSGIHVCGALFTWVLVMLGYPLDERPGWRMCDRYPFYLPKRQPAQYRQMIAQCMAGYRQDRIS